MSSGSQVWRLTVGLLFTACHQQAAPATSGEPERASRAQLAQRCPELLAPESARAAPPRGVFLEIAQLMGELRGPLPSSTSPSRLGPFDDPRLQVQRVAHLMVANDVASTLAWDTLAPDPTPTREPRRWDLKLTAHSETTGALRLEVDLAPAPPLGTPPEAWSIPEHRRVHTTVVVGEQQPVVLALPPGAGAPARSLMVVTPYFIREEADLRRLFQCKMRDHRRSAG